MKKGREMEGVGLDVDQRLLMEGKWKGNGRERWWSLSLAVPQKTDVVASALPGMIGTGV